MDIIASAYLRHDANITIVHGNEIREYIEFEKVAKKRYFAFSSEKNIFRNQFEKLAMPFLLKHNISKMVINWANQGQIEVMKELMPNVKEWHEAHHHISHAWSAYAFTKPSEGDLIASIDGGGDLDDYFKIYKYEEGTIRQIHEAKINLGKPYRLLGLLSPELYSDRDRGYLLDRPLSGKSMALLALGKVNEEYLLPLRRFYENINSKSVEDNFRELLDSIGFKGDDFLPQDEARDLLASSQRVFEEYIEKHLYPFLAKGEFSRLIMVGGCALNVIINSKISERFSIQMFIPPCPNDCGISIGIQRGMNPELVQLTSPFTELAMTGKDAVDMIPSSIKREKFSVERVAELIADGRVVGTVRGQMEIGPRALGNRSYLANPLSAGMKDKVNTLKGREFWRPVAPIVSIEKFPEYFDSEQESPYMTFAPKTKQTYADILREVTHIDGSARVQTVNKGDGWIYDLLKEVGKRTGFEIIMNTSFNKKGEPLINDCDDAINIFLNTDLDCLVIEDVIYSKI